MKIMRPIICQKLFAGLAKEKRSTTTLFHKSFPTNARITNANTNAKRVATELA
jgi:hypothetical protein